MKKAKMTDEANDLEARDYRVYRLKITLDSVTPPIWRGLEVYAGMEMDSLAIAIEAVFGWSGEHMGEFNIKRRRIGDGTNWLLEEDPRTKEKKILQKVEGLLKDSKSARSSSILFSLLKEASPEASTTAQETEDSEVPVLWQMVPRARTKFIYLYDFGDDWQHNIEVEKILEAVPGVHYPRCTGGARANAIEDCGGPWGYQDLIEAVGNPEHERYCDLEEWGLEKWDAEKFSAEEADRKLAKLFRRKKGRARQ